MCSWRTPKPQRRPRDDFGPVPVHPAPARPALGFVPVRGHRPAPERRSPAPPRAGPHSRSLKRPSDPAQPAHRRPARPPGRLSLQLDPGDRSRAWGSNRRAPLTGAGRAMALRGSARPPRPSRGTSPAASSSTPRPAPQAPPRRGVRRVSRLDGPGQLRVQRPLRPGGASAAGRGGVRGRLALSCGFQERDELEELERRRLRGGNAGSAADG